MKDVRINQPGDLSFTKENETVIYLYNSSVNRTDKLFYLMNQLLPLDSVLEIIQQTKLSIKISKPMINIILERTPSLIPYNIFEDYNGKNIE